MKIAIIGSGQDGRITDYSSSVIDSIILQCRSMGETPEFMIGDSRGTDATFNQLLASKGCSAVTKVYAIGYTKNNAFDLPTRLLAKNYDPEAEKLIVYDEQGEISPIEISGGSEEICMADRAYYGFIRKLLVDSCDIALLIWDGVDRGIKNVVLELNAKEKFMYLDKVAAL